MPRRLDAQLAIVLAVCGAVFFLNLGGPSLWDRDEPRNSGCAAEMLLRGDWVVPIFNDELRGQKPVLTYWLIMSAQRLFGTNEFAARFWSAALATGTVLWTLLIARRLLGATRAPIAAVALATFVMFDVAARAATPDSVLVFCFASALGLWTIGTFAPNVDDRVRTWSEPGLRHPGEWFPRHLGLTLPIYAALGAGLLAKGPVGYLLPIAVIGMFVLLGRLPATTEDSPQFGSLIRRLKRLARPWHPRHFVSTVWTMRPLSGTFVALLIAAPWYLLVGLRTEGDFLEAFFVREHVGRATTAMESHGGGIWYYPLALLIGTFPWSVLAIPMGLSIDRTLSRDRGERPLALVLGLAWVAIVVVAFTMASTKLPSYITPCHPAAALLVAWYVGEIVVGRELAPHWHRLAAAVLGLVGVALLIGVPIAAMKFEPSLVGLGAIGLIPLGGAIAWQSAIRRDRSVLAPYCLGGTAIVWSIAVFAIAPSFVSRLQRADDLLGVLADRPQARVASYGKLESTWVYYAGHPIWELAAGDVGAASLDRPRAWHPKPRPTLQAFLAVSEEPYVVTTADRVAELESAAAGRLVEIARVEALLDDQPIVLLGPPTVDRTAWDEGMWR
ncbi:MAG TPA: hypothetical protein DCQ98_01860 [Planctomycetaceae bacterium]|nr:hypothetical protein [Planctomycetaceae bacterium]HRF02013.1 glycosyltransferase family 39 protein [Pirellulaceae bacterium]